MHRTKRNTGGGAAAFGGTGYQADVATFLTIKMLAEAAAAPPCGLSADTTLIAVTCETAEATDDILTHTSKGGQIYIQAKSTVSLSDAEDSPFASALDQFTRQFLDARSSCRQLDPSTDRLILAVSPAAPMTIRKDAESVLKRLRDPSLPGDWLAASARNAKERKALDKILANVRRTWTKRAGSPPDETDLREFLQFVYIETWDVEAGGTDRVVAREQLRSRILANPSDDDQAWSMVFALADRLSRERTGITRDTTEQVLVGAGLKLQGRRSYQNDLERVRSYSGQMADLLRKYARFASGSVEVLIPRAAAAILTTAVEASSLIVTGDAGAGKSGALYNVYEELRRSGRDVVVIAADQIDATSLAAFRGELGLEHDFLDVMAAHLSPDRGVILIDALDADRAGGAGKMLRQLIELIQARNLPWNVLASVRTFELRNSMELQRLFRGSPPPDAPESMRDHALVNERHIRIPRLTDVELASVAAQVPTLGRLISQAPAQLRDLLTIPFNLRLFAELLDAGASIETLAPIHLRAQLLELYWQHRVRDQNRTDAREEALRRISLKMIATRRLRVRRADVIDSTTSDDAAALLRVGVLVEPDLPIVGRTATHELEFSHHLIFDYAVSVLLLRRDADAFAQILAANRTYAVILRPSIVAHFEYLWALDASRQTFWTTAFAVASTANVPALARVIGPAAAVTLARTSEDLQPLVEALQGSDAARKTAAENVFGLSMAAILADGGRRLAGASAGPWAALLASVGTITPRIAGAMRVTLHEAVEHPDTLTPQQLVAFGAAARALLTYAWTLPDRDTLLVKGALHSVGRTFASDRDASAALLRNALVPEKLQTFGYVDIPAIAHEIKGIAAADPEFAEDLYATAFSFEDASTEETALGGGALLRLTSNRRQDYQSAWYSLAQGFAGFLHGSPTHATRALVRAVEGAVARDRWGGDQRETVLFRYGDADVEMRVDAAASWEGISFAHDLATMLQALEDRMVQLSEQGLVTELQAIVETIAVAASPVLLWRRVLRAAGRSPLSFGRELVSLLEQPAFLLNVDAATAVASLMKKIAPHLSTAERARIEAAVGNLPTVPTDARERAERVRDVLAAALTPAASSTSNEQASDEEDTHEDDDLLDGGAIDQLTALSLAGVDVEAKDNRALQDAVGPVREFADKYHNEPAPEEAVKTAVSAMRTLAASIDRSRDADAAFMTEATDVLVAAAARIVATDHADAAAIAYARTLLLSGSTSPQPEYHEEYEGSWNSPHPSWSSADRIDAAFGLMLLARKQGAALDEDVRSAIERLASDPVAAVRFQVVANANLLPLSTPEFMWSIIERAVREEQRLAIVLGVIGPLQRLRFRFPTQTVKLLRDLLDRFGGVSASREVSQALVPTLTRLHLETDNSGATTEIERILEELPQHPKLAVDMLMVVRDAMRVGPSAPPTATADAIRARTFALLERMSRSALETYAAATGAAGFSSDGLPPEELERLQSLGRILDTIAHEVYFASGAFDDKRQDPLTDDEQAVRRRFCAESRSLIEVLTNARIPNVSDMLAKTLESFIEYDARDALVRMMRLLQPALIAGYQFEQEGVNLLVRVVERYLAQHPSLLLQDDECLELTMEAVDIFVDAGWPQAVRLAFRFEELFR